MAISNRAAITAGRSWAQARWDAVPARERPPLWPGTIREAFSLPLFRDVIAVDDGEFLEAAFVVSNAAELRWRELFGRESSVQGPSLLLTLPPRREASFDGRVI
jgi:hypothetical protein